MPQGGRVGKNKTLSEALVHGCKAMMIPRRYHMMARATVESGLQ